MAYALSKILTFFLIPSNVFVLLAAAALGLLLAGARRLAGAALALSLSGFVLFGWFPGGELLLAPLEARFPPVDPAAAAPPHGIIVLGGSVNVGHAARMGTAMEFDEAGERVPTAALLAHRFPEARIVVSGGDGAIFRSHPLREADGMKAILTAFGVAPERIAVERESRNTRENALRVAELIGVERGRSWWLITSAHHMPRAIGTFRKAGLDPTAFPVDFRRTPPFDPLYVDPVLSRGLRMTDVAVREWAGLLVYRLSGRTEALFPAPREEAADAARR